jgi:tripartite ATP-independent transporter DctM subunit
MTTAAFLLLFFSLLAIGCPIAYAMLIASAGYMALSDLPILQLTLRTTSGIDSFTLLAVPMFLFAGNLMNSMGVTERLFRFAGVLVRHVSGGLGQVNVVASIVFAGMSGSAVADAGGLGAVEIRAMRQAGYSRRFSAAITAASATIGPVIPPSITMVIYAFLSEDSVGRLFLAGAIPGLAMAGAMMVAVYFIARGGSENMPTFERAGAREVWDAFIGALPTLLAPAILLFGILGGIFTPTEASVVVVVYVFVIGVFYLDFDRAQIFHAVLQTVRTTSAAMFIIAVSHAFSWIITIQQVPARLTAFLGAEVESATVIMMLMVAVLLVVGMFMEVLAALILLVPTFLVLAQAFGIDTVHLGVVVVVVMMIGTITPPVGLVLFTVMAVANISMGELVRGLWPFYLAIFVVAMLVALFPQISLFLPNLVFGPAL